MSFVILQAVMKRLEERRKARLFARAGLDHQAAPLRPQPALARGHRAGRPGAAADDPHPRVPRPQVGGRHAGLGLGISDGLRVLIAPIRSRARSTRRSRRRRSPTAGDAADRPTRSSSSRWPTAARARSRRSRRPDPTGSSCPSHARDPLGRPLRATFLRRGDEGVVELAVGVRAVARWRPKSATRWPRPRSGPARSSPPRSASVCGS